MPAEDGYALIRSIRALPADDKKGVPAIALTAFARSEDRARALLAGFNVHMTKPALEEAQVKERALRREAEIANRGKDEFLATVSHLGGRSQDPFS